MVFVIFHNSWTDIKSVLSKGVDIGPIFRMFTLAGICVMYAMTYCRDQREVNEYFKIKSREYEFLNDDPDTSQVRLKTTRELNNKQN